jgi:hypothetical protein
MKKKRQEKISRRDALKKAGFKALSAATMMVLLNDTAKGQDDPNSPDVPPDWP